MTNRTWRAVALLLILPGPLVAQTTEPARGAFTASAGVGTGAGAFTCGRMTFAQAVVQWHPMQSAGGFVKAGGGWSWLRDELRVTQLDPAVVTRAGPAFVIGAGWDVRVAPAWAITPYADLDVAVAHEQRVNGVSNVHELGGRLVHVGIALIYRR